jgi:hypothetical protein
MLAATNKQTTTAELKQEGGVLVHPWNMRIRFLCWPPRFTHSADGATRGTVIDYSQSLANCQGRKLNGQRRLGNFVKTMLGRHLA